MIEINEGVLGPKRASELLASHEFSPLLEQCNQKQKRLTLKLEPDTLLSEFAGAKIDLENAETNRAHG